MNRKIFFSQLSWIAAAIIFVNLFSGCGREPETPRVDFTIDLNDPQYSTLYSLGEYVYLNNIIIARAVNGDYIALQQYCSRDACDLQYEVSQDDLRCSCDGSLFSDIGTVNMGPATAALQTYTTQLIGTKLRVYTP